MPATPDLRALLLTDVVDSTQLTEALGDAAMAELWTVHDRVARDLLPLWRGREIDKTDGMLLLFDDVHDAVGYALAYHRGLAQRALPFKARAGIHVGPVSLRPNPPDDVARGAKPVEVDGIALPIAARVMSVALGAQTLLSADARLALGVAPQRVISHGHWRMHGVADPVELFEVGESGAGSPAPFSAPPDGAKVYRVMRQGELWQPVREVRHSVPAERDSFVGRQEPLQLLAQKLEAGARLVSVLGMGGTGKTRLVTRFAWTVLGDYPGGVWFCDLSQARSVDGIHFAVAQGLDVPLGKPEPVVQLAHAIAGRGRCLVILDNFEQIARHAEATLGRWLDRAPLAHFLVTTREVLGIVGEETLALAPLAVPEAVALFTQRAQAARSGTCASPEELTAIPRLVKVLDGLPLAIELAAARVRVTPPHLLLARMNERFDVLLSRAGRSDRQATMRATLDWSWELLSEAERRGLAQLSVFKGGFTLESAQAVLDLTGVEPPLSPVDVVQWLVDKSLVRQLAAERFDLFETVREYAAEHLGEPGANEADGPPGRDAVERRHGIYFARLGPKRATQQACADADNLVVACQRATSRGDAVTAADALAGAWGALMLRGPFSVGLDIATRIQSIQALPPRAAAIVLRIRGCALTLSGRMAEARTQFEEAIRTSSTLADPSILPRTRADLAELSMREGRTAEALGLFTAALEGRAAVNDASFDCNALSGCGTCHEYLGQMDEARKCYELTLSTARSNGVKRWEGGALGNLGQLSANLGRSDAARSYYEAALGIARELDDRQWEGNVRCNLGLLHHDEGRLDDARHHLAASLQSARELGHARLESIVLCNLGIVEEAAGSSELAGDYFIAAIELARNLADRRSEGQFLGYLGALHTKLGRLAKAETCLSEGLALLRNVADRYSLAIVLCAVAERSSLAGRNDLVEPALTEARQIARELGGSQTSELALALARAQAAVSAPGAPHQ